MELNINEFKSKRVAQLENEIKMDSTASELFWRELHSQGAPLIEAIDNDEDNSLVTFFYKGDGDTSNIVIHGTGVGFDYMENRMARLLDTDIWYKSFRMAKNIEFVYWLSVNDALDDDGKKRYENFITDPLNKQMFVMKDDVEEPTGKDFEISHVRMPLALPKKWVKFNNADKKGRLDKYDFKSDTLDNNRRVWVYTPWNYMEGKEECNLLVLNDGNTYVKWLSAVEILDKLIIEKLIPPTVAVFVSSVKTRYEELTCNDSYSKFIVDEILPFVHSNYSVSSKPEKTIIGGLSIGGLAAAYLGLRYSNIFGNVLSQSGSFFWKPQTDEKAEWLVNQYENMPSLPLSFYITYGILENSPKAGPTLIQSNKRLLDILESKAYKVTSNVFNSGHDYLNWDETLAEGLISLIGL